MTAIDTLTNESLEVQRKAAYVERLWTGLNREPQSYEYKGEIIDMGPEGQCVCGHRIQQGFVLHHKDAAKNDRKVVGSSCVNHFAAIDTALYASLLEGLAELNRRIAEAKKAAKKAADAAEVASLRERYEAAYDAHANAYRALKEAGLRASRELWGALNAWYRLERNAPEYQRACDYKRWYKQQIERIGTDSMR